MLFQPSEYIFPTSIEDSVTLLDRFGERAAIIAGGVTLYEAAKRGLLSHIDTLLDISKIGLDHIFFESDLFMVQSMVTFSRLSEAPEIRRNCYAALADCLHKFVPLQVKNLATVGGSLCSGLPFLDLPTILVALGAKLRISGPKNVRTLPLNEFYHGMFQTDLRKGEMLAGVDIAAPRERTGSAFVNLKRNAVDIPVLSTVASVTLGRDDTCASISFAMGGVAETVVRVGELERSLLGKKLTQEEVARACRVLDSLDPIESISAGSDYKRELAKVLAEEVLLRAGDRATGVL